MLTSLWTESCSFASRLHFFGRSFNCSGRGDVECGGGERRRRKLPQKLQKRDGQKLKKRAKLFSLLSLSWFSSIFVSQVFFFLLLQLIYGFGVIELQLRIRFEGISSDFNGRDDVLLNYWQQTWQNCFNLERASPQLYWIASEIKRKTKGNKKLLKGSIKLLQWALLVLKEFLISSRKAFCRL